MSRKIASVVPAKKASGAPISRLIGTTDIDGEGTTHSLPQVDPFMLLDHANLPQSDLPPFGAHPHYGHSVVTLLLQGQEKSWDSFTNKDTVVKAPASYYVDAGSGLFHNEVSVVPNPDDPSQHISLYQLWISVNAKDRRKPAKLQYDTNLPLVDAKDDDGAVVGEIRYYIGGGGTIQTIHPITVAHVAQKAGTSFKFPIPKGFGGFVVSMTGSHWLHRKSTVSAFFSEGRVEPGQPNDVLVLENDNDGGEQDGYLLVQTSPSPATEKEAVADYLVCIGERIGEPWFKKLVANGAVIAASEDEVREMAEKVEGYAAAGKSKENGSFAPFGVDVDSLHSAKYI